MTTLEIKFHVTTSGWEGRPAEVRNPSETTPPEWFMVTEGIMRFREAGDTLRNIPNKQVFDRLLTAEFPLRSGFTRLMCSVDSTNWTFSIVDRLISV